MWELKNVFHVGKLFYIRKTLQRNCKESLFLGTLSFLLLNRKFVIKENPGKIDWNLHGQHFVVRNNTKWNAIIFDGAVLLLQLIPFHS